MPNFANVEILTTNSKVSEYTGKKPSEIEKSILEYNTLVITVCDLYDATEAVSQEFKINDITDVINNYNNANNAKKKQQMIKEFEKYREEMTAIDERGRSKASRFKFAMTHWHQNTKELIIREKNNQNIGGQYTEFQEVSDVNETNKNKLNTFKECIEDVNKLKLLSFINSLNTNIEGLKQLRDFKIAQNKGKIDSSAAQENEGHIYSYGDHQNFISNTQIQEIINTPINSPTLSNSDRDKIIHFYQDSHLIHIQKERELEQRFDQSGVGKVLNNNMIISYLSFDPTQYDRDIQNVQDKQVFSDLRARVTENGSDPLTTPQLQQQQTVPTQQEETSPTTISGMIAKLLNDDGGELQALLYDISEFTVATFLPLLEEKGYLKAGSDIGRFYNTYNIGNLFESMTEEQKAIARGTKLNKNGEDLIIKTETDENNNTINTVVSQKDLQSQYKFAGALDVVNSVSGLVSLFFQYKEFFGDDGIDFSEMGAVEDAKLKKFEDFCEKIELIISTFDSMAAISKTGVDFATAAGTLALGGTEIASTAFEHFGGLTSMLSGILSMIKGFRQIHKDNGAREAVVNSKTKIENIYTALSLEDQERLKVKKNQADRFLKRTAAAEDQNLAQAGLDTVTGALNLASGVSTFIPGANVIGAAIGVFASAASFAGKLAISKYFKDKRVDEAWESVLGYDHSQYKALIRAMGGKADERFHNVLRRKTGIATRTDYAESLAVTDAVDLYAAAHAYPLINAADLDNPTQPEQQIIKAELEGMQFSEPNKYKNITLKAILEKQKLNADWKGTLKKAITNNAQFNFKEDVSSGEADKIRSGAYD